MKLILGDCLEELKKLPANSIDSIVTDPPYFLTNSSGSGFMGKEWDSLSVKNVFVEAILKSLVPALDMDEESFAQLGVKINFPLEKKKSYMSVQSVISLLKEPSRKLNQEMFFAPELVLTKQEVLVLLRGLSPSLIGVIEKNHEDVLYAVKNMFTESCHKTIALQLAIILSRKTALEELKTLLTLTEDQKTRGALEGKTGKISEEKFISAITLSVEDVKKNVEKEKSSVTTSPPIDLQKIIQTIISLPFVKNAMGLFMENPGNTQIISELFHEKWASEVLRVLKPGGHLLSFSGTRTYHSMVTAIERAGFEIRDQIQWIYGSGFPKSLNISKAIDKEAGLKRERTTGTMGSNNTESMGKFNLGEAISDQAIKWDGWGTALKPANEPIVLARKPISEKTVAKNFLKWGVGGLNVDGCRVEASDQKKLEKNWDRVQSENNKSGTICREGGDLKPVNLNLYKNEGRFPANLIFSHHEECEPSPQVFVDGTTQNQCHEDCAVRMLDEQSGILKSGGKKNASYTNENDGIFTHGGEQKSSFYGSNGGDSRFFYCAKTSKRERNEGLEGEINSHPTLKPIKLMTYLCKLVTPPNGIILDPFMGSGSTGIAAKKEGFNFIGIEKEKEYFEIAKKRINHGPN